MTERRKLENQFRQAQKLESLGQLAGGVAHDFNNLLTIILGQTEEAMGGLDSRNPMRAQLTDVADAATRAANLTRQLLQFSRQQSDSPRNLDVVELLSKLEQLLTRLLGEHIRIRFELAPNSGVICADENQFGQTILNLATNARDAMPEGGELTIATSRVVLFEPLSCGGRVAPAGEYVEIRVADTGMGMTPEVQARIFEPFFTTKEVGKGTGLGLATVYGIVNQSEGYIAVESVPGEGTTFRMLFPFVSGATAAADSPAAKEKLTGTETVLVVEDEPGVLSFVRRALETSGYRALDCLAAPDAIAIAENFEGPIHLLLTDVVLPEMNGAEVVSRFRAIRPGVPAICMSGYPERFGVRLEEGIECIRKPFSREQLLGRIRALLDAAARPKLEGEPEVPRGRIAVLVVEDSKPVRALVVRTLQKAGYAVAEAASSEEGLAAFDTGTFALIISDLNLDEEGDGERLLLRCQAARPEVKCVLMTGSAAGEKMHGEFRVLAKPFDRQELIDLARELIGSPVATLRSV